jgi:hypothetical protein
MQLRRRVLLVTCTLAVIGCSSNVVAGLPSVAPLPMSPPGLVQFSGSPSPSVAAQPTLSLASRIPRPLPSGLSTATVTLFTDSDTFAAPSATVVYRKVVTDPDTINALTTMVNGLDLDSGETQGCVPIPVQLQIVFGQPTFATFDEDTECARATLAEADTPTVTVDSSLAAQVEKLLGVTVVTNNGQPTIASEPRLR